MSGCIPVAILWGSKPFLGYLLALSFGGVLWLHISNPRELCEQGSALSLKYQLRDQGAYPVPLWVTQRF